MSAVPPRPAVFGAPARRAVVAVVALLGAAVLVTSVVAAAPAARPASASSTVGDAVAFVVSQQRADGGFGASEAGFAGFETPDAVLAIAESAQSGGWDPATALAAVQAVQYGGSGGPTGLHYLDDWADGAFGAIGAGPAARLVLVADALGLDPAAFDPDGDGAADLLGLLTAGLQPDGSFGAGVLNTTLSAVLAYRAAGLSVPAATVAYVLGAQQPNGSWDYGGDPSGSEADPDTTGLALQALIAAGEAPSSPAVQAGLAFLAGSQYADGTWGEAFAGDSNPNSTALAVLGVTAAGFDVSTSCWRDKFAPDRAGSPYTSPLDALAVLQAPDGHIASPFDQYGLNTIGTSQAVQALLRSYLPLDRADSQPCETATTTTTSTTAPSSTTTTGASTTTTDPASTTTTTTTDGPSTTTTDVTVGGAATTTTDVTVGVASTSTTWHYTAATTTTTSSWRSGGGTLPRTGAESLPLAWTGLTAVAAGLALAASRKPRV